MYRLILGARDFMALVQQALSQFETPADVADLLIGFCLRRPADRVLDPGCGRGSLLRRAAKWLDWLAATSADLAPDGLWGMELDPLAAVGAQEILPKARILNQNFLTLQPGPNKLFDAIIGNPPYTRAQWIGQIETKIARQLPLFNWPEKEGGSDKLALIPAQLANTLSGRSGLHGYFFLHSNEFLLEGGRLAFVVPNGWLDVAYGSELKQYLLDHFRILAIVESSVERWFADASVNTCLVVLEKCGGFQRRSGNQVRLVRLKQPLRDLIPQGPDNAQRFLAVENLITRLLPMRTRNRKEFTVNVIQQRTLKASDKWGIALRAPAVFRQQRDHMALFPMKEWAFIQRGFTTGANEFFYLDKQTVKEWSIEQEFRRPLLKSLRGIHHLTVKAENCWQEVLIIPPDADLRGKAVEAYLKWGETQGYHLRQTCAARTPWYSIPLYQSAPLVLPKGIWHHHMSPLLPETVTVDQQLYLIQLVENIPIYVAAALLNSAWFALQLELQGRVNFGKGLLWLAAYEIEDVRLPDPRRMKPDEISTLIEALQPMLKRELGDTIDELDQPDREQLDNVVFDILEFSASERSLLIESLKERLTSRRQLAEERLSL